MTTTLLQAIAAVETLAARLEFNDDEMAAAMRGIEYALRDTIQNAVERPALGASPPVLAPPKGGCAGEHGPPVGGCASTGRHTQGGCARTGQHDLDQLITSLHDDLIGSGIAAENGKYMGFIPGGGLPVAAVGDFLAAVSNRYAGMTFAAPVAVSLEHEVIAWFRDIFSLPGEAWGTLTSGGSVANLIAIVAARSRIAPEERTRAVAYLTSHGHHSLQKALNIAGLDGAVIRHVPTDAALRMDPTALAAQIAADRAAGLKPWLIMASAGTTNTGSIDPMASLAAIARTNDVWFHVDAAYGGFFNLLDELKPRLSGIGEADSLTVDPHKGLFMPYGTGAVLVRDGALLRRALAFQADYLQEESVDARSPAEYSVELTRHFRAPRIILALRHHGVATFVAAIREKFLLAQWLYEELGTIPEIELPLTPELSVVAFGLRSTAQQTAPQRTEAFLEWLLPRGRCYISSTKWHGRSWLRACILSFRTHRPEVTALIDEVRAFINEGR